MIILQAHISPADAGSIRGRIEAAIHLVLSELSIPPSVVKVVVALLTWRKHLAVYDCWQVMSGLIDKHTEWDRLLWDTKSPLVVFQGEHIHDASYMWLYKTLAADMELKGVFLADEYVYTDLALLYARALKKRVHRYAQPILDAVYIDDIRL